MRRASSSASERDTLRRDVAAVVNRAFGRRVVRAAEPDAPLVSSRDEFDSFALLELVLRLEEAFGIRIPDEDLDLDNFRSVATLADYVRRRQQGEG
jgi:acyl carrier protein